MKIVHGLALLFGMVFAISAHPQHETRCPSLYPYMGKRVYYPGQSCMGSCPHEPHKKYKMVCKKDGTWLKYDSICGMTYKKTTSSSVHHVYEPADHTTYPGTTETHCPSLYPYMEKRVYYPGQTCLGSCPHEPHKKYRMVCQKDGTWLKYNSICEMAHRRTTDSSVHHVYKPAGNTVHYVNTPTHKVTHHVYKPNPPTPYQYYTMQKAEVKCPYMSVYMDPKYAHKSFDVGARMKFTCLKQKGRYFIAWCDSNGVWMMNPGSCYTQKPKKGLPFWLLFLLGQKQQAGGLGPQPPQSTDPYFVSTDPYIVPTDPPYIPTIPPYV